MPGGRKTKYTPECVAKIIQAIKLAATYELAASYAGISAETFYLWKRTKPEFLQQIKAAEGEGAIGWLAKIELAANAGNWQAAAWKLERRYPHEYGRSVRDTTNLDINVAELTDEELDQIANGENPRTVIARRATLGATSAG